MPPPISSLPLEHILSRLASILPLHPSPIYVSTLLSTIPANTSEAALLASLRYRVLNSDFTQSLLAPTGTTFPVDVHMNNKYLSAAPGAVLTGPIAAQVVDVVDLGRSCLEELDRLEMEERGERKKGREIVRIAPVGEEGEDGVGGNGGAGDGGGSKGPHKLLMEDANGRRVWGFEIEKISGIEVGGKMKLGTKILLKNVPIIRDLLMLQPTNTTILGGKIDAWEQGWAERRRKKLEEVIGREGK